MFSKQLIAVILCVLPALAASSSLIPVKKTKNSIPGRYIVTFKEGVDRVVGASSLTSNISSQSVVTHEWDIINAVAGNFTDDDLESLRSLRHVASIHEDGHARTQTIFIQTSAPWGLARISSQTRLENQDANALTFRYKYDTSAGAGSDVYIIDTGIFISHPNFEGRASWGATFGGYDDADGSGHGTHCAGIAVSGPYGVAKSAKVIAVKVLGDDGHGHWSDIISGIDWVAKAAKKSSRPSVASLSIGNPTYEPADDAVTNLVSSGVTTVVAAGNDGADAYRYSPARVPSVITVAASTIADDRANYSNWGGAIDIWAPGSNIVSTWNDGKTNTLDGTSMAAPHVAGYAAYLLTIDSSLTPATVNFTIKSQSLKGAINGILTGTTHDLLNNGLY